MIHPPNQDESQITSHGNPSRFRFSVGRSKRNRFIDDELPNLNGYYGMTAQRSAMDRRARRRKLVRLVDLRNAVIAQLKAASMKPESLAPQGV
jgi:IS30 family transposase